jgi:hypothetical protein
VEIAHIVSTRGPAQKPAGTIRAEAGALGGGCLRTRSAFPGRKRLPQTPTSIVVILECLLNVEAGPSKWEPLFRF